LWQYPEPLVGRVKEEKEKEKEKVENLKKTKRFHPSFG